jgi:hypothetical protein
MGLRKPQPHSVKLPACVLRAPDLEPLRVSLAYQCFCLQDYLYLYALSPSKVQITYIHLLSSSPQTSQLLALCPRHRSHITYRLPLAADRIASPAPLASSLGTYLITVCYEKSSTQILLRSNLYRALVSTSLPRTCLYT